MKTPAHSKERETGTIFHKTIDVFKKRNGAYIFY